MKLVFGEQEKQRLLTEARMIQTALPVLGPMLEARKGNALKRLLAAHRDGKLDAASVAEIAIIDSMESEIRAKLQNLTVIQER